MDTEGLVTEKLLCWENEVDPLAPLTEKQLKLIRAISEISNDRGNLIENSPKDEMVLLPKITSVHNEEKLNFIKFSPDDVVKYSKVENAQQFLSWFTSVEEQLVEDEDVLFKFYLEELTSHCGQYNMLFDELCQVLESLENLREKYTFVSNKTNSLHEACEHLLTQQTKLVSSAETISEKLSYFNELESLSQKISSPTLSVVNESFMPLLSRLDECIVYVEENINYKESPVYLARFRHLQSQALGMIRSYVVATLQQATQQVLPRRDSLSPSENAFTLYYGKFRSHAPRIQALMKQIEERVEKNPDYTQLLYDCHQCYFQQRELLLGPSVSAAINDLAEKHQKDHCSLVRSGCAFLLHICEDEHQLFHQFFSHNTQFLEQFLEGLCIRLYDVLRPIIIHINHLETLAELCGILKVEMLEEHIQYGANELEAVKTAVHQMLEDVQERLVYRTHIYIKTDILNYNPGPGDLAYPDKLEMMESIAESLSLGGLSRASSRASLTSLNSISNAVLTEASNSSSADKGEDTNSVKDFEPYEPPKRTITYSPADLHGMWYPTVRRTLVCLSKLYRCLDKTIFQGLSQEVLTMCIQSLISASATISKNKTLLDGQLFEIKHLLILREQIAPFQIDFAIKETTLDFSNVKMAAYSLLQNRTHLLSMNSSNAILEFLLQGTPHVIEHLIDSKKAVDKQLKVVCEEFISHTVTFLIGSLQEFLSKAKVVSELQASSSNQNISLSQQPFANADALSQLISDNIRGLKSKLPTLHRCMSLYLANPDTEYILLRPVKIQIQSCFEQLLQLIRVNYSEEEQVIIACPSSEQLTILLSPSITK
ncbi:conserved oligomeric Golgi complex subunit 3 [Parasteatoda tepidariorum]|uniref:conserved oligomeric Golgi complex subunit 3 n=1 Tax=Parasteatoda tepidariorum TaxID=114398 RepID=UPI001C724674|nr:conserved oligomeric Golgi complex subunit 3 isoform X2 [Parasteatoda tepidariorum]